MYITEKAQPWLFCVITPLRCRDAAGLSAQLLILPLSGGFDVLSVAQGAGVVPDCHLYTGLITTCMNARRLDLAFKVSARLNWQVLQWDRQFDCVLHIQIGSPRATQ